MNWLVDHHDTRLRRNRLTQFNDRLSPANSSLSVILFGGTLANVERRVNDTTPARSYAVGSFTVHAVTTPAPMDPIPAVMQTLGSDWRFYLEQNWSLVRLPHYYSRQFDAGQRRAKALAVLDGWLQEPESAEEAAQLTKLKRALDATRPSTRPLFPDG